MPRAMRAPRKSTPSPPSAADIDAGAVGPMDIPISSPIPILRLKRREYLRQKRIKDVTRHNLKIALLVGHQPKQPIRLARHQRSRSSHGLPITTLMDKLQKLQDMDEEFHVGKNMSVRCYCRSCVYLRRWSSTLQPYRCTNKNCRIKFDSFTDMYEHQLDVHGGLDPRANRVVEDVFHQQQGTLAFPPATVYAAQQYMVPTRPPTPWKSMKELDEEAKIVREKLWVYNRYCWETPFKLFDTGYKLVKRNGWKEMQRQYHIAMEHFFSAMKFPASSRGFHDGCPSVELGRNWLTSTDREDSRLIHPFSLGDRMEVEPEFVLIDTKRDQEMEEMCIEISDDSDLEDAYDKTDSDDKSFKKDDDVEMQAPDDDDPAKERKVFDIDSDDDIELKNSEADEGEVTSEHNVFDVDVDIDSDSDSDVTVKSEVASDSENDAGEVKSDDSDSDIDSELKLSQHGDSDSASDSDSGDEDQQKVKGCKNGIDDTVSATESENDSDSDDEDEDKVKDLRGEDIASATSDSDSSDSGEEHSSKGPVFHEVSSSSEDSDSEVESKVSQANSTKFVSDSDSEDESGEELNTSSSQDIFNQLE